LAQTVPLPSRIDLVVAEGEGVVNNLHHRVAHDPVVKVVDDDQRPVANAAVVFSLPVSGASGEFGNGSKNLTIVTDTDGVAAARGLKTNEASGKLQILVTASYRGLRARALINQFNMASSSATGQKHGSGGKVAVILALVGAAAAGGVVAATHKGSSPASSPAVVAPTPIGITPGTGTIGAPH